MNGMLRVQAEGCVWPSSDGPASHAAGRRDLQQVRRGERAASQLNCLASRNCDVSKGDQKQRAAAEWSVIRQTNFWKELRKDVCYHLWSCGYNQQVPGLLSVCVCCKTATSDQWCAPRPTEKM